MYAISLDISRPFVASVFCTPLAIRTHGNLYLFLIVTSLDNMEATQQYSVVTWYHIENIFPDPICAVQLE